MTSALELRSDNYSKRTGPNLQEVNPIIHIGDKFFDYLFNGQV